jgi:hypothetical protein
VPPRKTVDAPEGANPELSQIDPKAVPEVAKKANAKVQTVFDQESAQGFRGVEVDKTPNENYTVQGVLAGAPTPETDIAGDPTKG